MEDRFKAILDALPEKPARSRLDPYAELIDEMRRRGRTYREIQAVLASECQVRTSISTLHDFVQTRSGQSGVDRVRPRHRKLVETSALPERILRLKQEKAKPPKSSAELFDFDPSEPLHLPTDRFKS